ncbi:MULTISPECIES: universal stress protein [unclassified Kribbella]|uniref:universal stress protein n=1 Tax=unclassified Kribbella TaxID=2644121 RepID=UPI00301977B3
MRLARRRLRVEWTDMDKYIVVGVDETRESQIALQWAVEAARTRGAAVRVVRSVYSTPVVYWPTIGAEGYIPVPPLDQCQAELDEAVDYVRDRLGNDAGSGRLAYESPAMAILEHAEGAEMIVLGTKSPNRWQAAVMGSVVTAVTARASCPVAVVRGEQHDGPIVVGTDGSADSEAAVEFAFEEANRSGRPLTVVYCWQPIDRHDQPVADTHAVLRYWLTEASVPTSRSIRASSSGRR